MIYLVHRKQHRVRQSEEIKNCVPNERSRQNLTQKKIKTEMSNLADKRGQNMIVKMLRAKEYCN